MPISSAGGRGSASSPTATPVIVGTKASIFVREVGERLNELRRLVVVELQRLVGLHLRLHAVGLGERLLRVGERRVREAPVAPAGAPAVPDDERVGRVADEGDRVAAVGRLRLVDVENPLRRRGLVPGESTLSRVRIGPLVASQTRQFPISRPRLKYMLILSCAAIA